MNIYIFERIEELTSRWHSGGGLIIIAKSREDAEKLLDEKYRNIGDWLYDKNPIILTDDDWAKVITYKLSARQKVEPVAYLFPNAGCC